MLNRLRDELRRKGRLPEMTDLDSVNYEGQSPIEETIGRETVDEYEQALGRLKPEEQEAIIGRVEMGYSYEELSRVLGKPTPDAARKAAQRALVRLAEEMKRGAVTALCPMSPARFSTGPRSTGRPPNRAPTSRSAHCSGRSGGWPTLADFHRGLPTHWGHLRLVEVIGRGAFAEVYRAWDTRLDREVALKLLTAAAPTGDALATSIIEEGRLLARVRHPNVVTIYGADRIDDRVGLWMEFVKGRTLEQVLQQGHVFDLRRSSESALISAVP